MGNNLDNGFGHENKIKEKGLNCAPLSGFNHLAIYMKWAYNKGFIKEEVLKNEPRLKPAMEGNGDLREVISERKYLKGRIQSYYFTDLFQKFSEWFYRDYCRCVDKNAEAFFGTEKYNSDEFQDEAYLFVPYDQAYYESLSGYIEQAWEGRPLKLEGKSIGKENLDDILAIIKEKSETDVIVIKTGTEETNLFSSKLGGLPYWPLNEEYPTDGNGDKLVLLAQINLADVVYEKLPGKGLLQFFVAFDDCLGLDEEKGYKVVYHENIDTRIKEEDIRKLGIKSNEDLQEEFYMFPTNACLSLTFSVQKDCLQSLNDEFDGMVSEILREKYGYVCNNFWDFLSEEDFTYLTKNQPKCNHKMFGYPFFTQGDPRCDKASIEKYNTLLFQLDSEYEEPKPEICIGDSGVINFFINDKDLADLNFEDVLYYWDCY